MKHLTVKELKKALDYDPESGNFIRKFRDDVAKDVNTRYAGKIAGTTTCTHGYVSISINNRHYLGHRLAFLFMTGKWPEDEVDHINMKRADNRWVNLRLATSSQNKMNINRRRNKSGFKGVCFHKHSGLWHATIMRDRKKISLGYFKKPEEAAAAYADFSKNNDGSFYRV